MIVSNSGFEVANLIVRVRQELLVLREGREQLDDKDLLGRLGQRVDGKVPDDLRLHLGPRRVGRVVQVGLFEIIDPISKARE